MLRNADIIVTARDGKKLVGVSRAVTDFAYCCYLSDLAVDVAFQHKGIGKRLVDETHLHAGKDKTTLVLLAEPRQWTTIPRSACSVTIAAGSFGQSSRAYWVCSY